MDLISNSSNLTVQTIKWQLFFKKKKSNKWRNKPVCLKCQKQKQAFIAIKGILLWHKQSNWSWFQIHLRFYISRYYVQVLFKKKETKMEALGCRLLQEHEHKNQPEVIRSGQFSNSWEVSCIKHLCTYKCQKNFIMTNDLTVWNVELGHPLRY